VQAALNGYEGGAECGSCVAGSNCEEDGDCASLLCEGGICEAPSCTDGTRNGSETDIDCGGDCERCENGSACLQDADCESTNCDDRTCQPVPTCAGTPAEPDASYYDVIVAAATSCAGYVTYFANSLSEARSCAEDDNYRPISSACSYWLQVEGENLQITADAESGTDAITCAKNTYCYNCSYSVLGTAGCVTQ
jgi:hypothetical protein